MFIKANCVSYDYWDGKRQYGYGGYVYDGRWNSVAKKLILFLETYEIMTLLIKQLKIMIK